VGSGDIHWMFMLVLCGIFESALNVCWLVGWLVSPGFSMPVFDTGWTSVLNVCVAKIKSWWESELLRQGEREVLFL